jgi:hypothetical protein
MLISDNGHNLSLIKIRAIAPSILDFTGRM